MEKHVFKFGGNSWAVVLPKAWIERNGVDKGKLLLMNEDDSGNLVVSAGTVANKEAELILDPGVSPEVAGRWAGLYYRAGVKKLNIYANGDNAGSIFKFIQDFIKSYCPGFEVTGRSSKTMIITDFTDIKDAKPEMIFMRIKSIIEEELKFMGAGDMAGIAYSEDTVNRFFTLGLRYVNMVGGRDAVRDFDILQLLEIISDELYEISKGSISKKNLSIFGELGKELELCFSALAGNYNALEAAVANRDKIFKSLPGRFDRLDAYLLTEITKNMIKIAEFCLEAKQKEPSMAP